MMKIIKVEKIGENRGFCREYFKNVETGTRYARQKTFNGKFQWFIVDKNGEPSSPLKDDIRIVRTDTEEEYKKKRLDSIEKILRR